MANIHTAWTTSRPLTVVEKLKRIPWFVLFLTCLIAAAGTATLYSVSDGSFQPWAERHTLRFLIVLAIAILMALVRLEVWIGFAYPFYGAVLAMLALVPFVGVEALGARRWIGTETLSFQPSELMKLALVAALARYYFTLPTKRLGQFRALLPALGFILLPVGLTLIQPDLGSAVLLVGLGLSMMFLAGVPLGYFVGGGLGVLTTLPLLWSRLHDYQRRRIEVFLDPSTDPFGSGYHITQSKIALGSGGLFGKGFMQGTQSKLDFVPEKHTDFIASIIGEEWGFAGLMVLVAIYAVIIGLMMLWAWRCENLFARLVVAGSAMTFFLYVFINLSMVTGLVPVVGVPLPLVSYGGTSMTTLMLCLGLALCGYVHGERGL